MRLLLLFIFLTSHLSYAQDFFAFLSPDSPSTSIEVEGIYLPNKNVENEADDTQLINSAAGINQKVFKDDLNQIVVGAKYQKLDLTSHSSVLPDFYKYEGSVNYKRILSDDKFWLASLSYGTASDKPFKNGRDSTLGANYIHKVNSKWFVIANYSNNRAFLNNVPLPGFIYVQEMTREKAFVIGFPFLMWMRPVSQNFSIRYFGLLPWFHRLRLLYTNWGFVQPYIGFEQAPQNYFRSDREERTDRFFWFERKIVTGIEARLIKGMRLDLSGGLAFDRQFFEAKNFSEKKEFTVNVENAWFTALSVRYNF